MGEQRLPGAASVGQPPEQDEVGIARHGREVLRCKGFHDAIALVLDGLDLGQQARAVRQGGPGDLLRRRGEVVGHPHEAQRVDHLGCGHEITQPPPGQREGLAHRPGHHELRVCREQAQCGWCAGPGELGIRLVDDDHRVGCRVKHGPDDFQVERGAGGVVGRAEEDDMRGRGQNLGDDVALGQVEGPVRPAAVSVDPRRTHGSADDRVHGVGRGEAQRHAPRSGESLHDMLEHFVGAVASPHLRGLDRHPGLLGEPRCEVLPQRGELPVGIAVEVARRPGDGSGDRGDDVGRDGIGVLVGVQAHGDLQLRSPVCRLAAQVVAKESGDARSHVGRHRRRAHGVGTASPNRAVTAWPWPGRSSAWASVTTW
ncbi:MAG: hypothetical protein BWY91_01946 [bacterium ADurb.BinA028]|nr:MAG: hypothetical protein BWY91_01946 [bacterium ADurb.BinA028]